MIYMILGDTNAGKDTILNGVASDKHLKSKKVVQYTTRPKREYEKDGKDYLFCKDWDFEYFFKYHKLIYSYYVNTEHGVWWYGVEKQKFNDDTDYIMTGNLTALKGFIDNGLPIIPIFIHADLDVRKARALKRDGSTDKEVYRRLQQTDIQDILPSIPSELLLDNNKTYPDHAVKVLTRAIERCRINKYKTFHLYKPDRMIQLDELNDKIDSIYAKNKIQLYNRDTFVEKEKKKHENTNHSS